MLWLLTFMLMAQQQTAAEPQWERVAVILPYVTVYVPPYYTAHSVENQKRLTEIAYSIIGDLVKEKGDAIVVDFFDNRKMTPVSLPYPPESKVYWQARLSYAHDGQVRFEWEPSNGK
jgi:hypothetical protein